jgi:hypothetical protein
MPMILAPATAQPANEARVDSRDGRCRRLRRWSDRKHSGGAERTARALTQLLLLSLVACAPAPAPEPAEDRIPVIDAHIHTDFTGQPEPVSGIVDSRDSLLAAFERAGVVGAVAHTDTLGGGWADLSDRGVIHCGGVGGTPDLARLESGLSDGRYRCLKLYPGYVYLYPTDFIYEPVYTLAARFDVPVVIHTGDTYSSDGRLRFADPLHVDDLAVAHRDVRFVIAHAGYPWFQTAAEVAYKNPNVWIEASALMIGDPATADPAWLERYVVEPIGWVFGYIEDPTKLMFASDWPLVDIEGYVEAYKQAIPREHWQAVLHDNAVAVFGLDESR